ncbi:hypothetical protein ANAPC5_01467 [Anaplasma phagocytophilum]|nr:hypothetical protein ANAPC5_01467 [Anaplasma phagocytophilum]
MIDSLQKSGRWTMFQNFYVMDIEPIKTGGAMPWGQAFRRNFTMRLRTRVNEKRLLPKVKHDDI